MGKPTNPEQDSDALSLHTNPEDTPAVAPVAGSSRFIEQLDDDDLDAPDDDLPPVYTDVAETSALIPPDADMPTNRSQSNPSFPNMIPVYSVDQNNGDIRYMDSRLESDPDLLENLIRFCVKTPPRTYIRLLGHHWESRREHDGKRERRKVVDFDIRVDITPYLYTDVATGTSAWSSLRTVENDEKVKRGTALACRAPGFKKPSGRITLEDAPQGWPEKPTLREWCHRYCASAAGLKVFVLQKNISGLDEALLAERLHGLVRSTSYQGHLNIAFPREGARVEVYNDCRVNRWRTNFWLTVLSWITLTFLIRIPYLFFRTSWFETTVAEWPFSRPAADGDTREYTSLNEDQLYSLWGAAVHKAVMGRRQGVLDQQDLVASHTDGHLPDMGNTGVNAALGFVAAGVRAMNVVDRQFGWGYDR